MFNVFLSIFLFVTTFVTWAMLGLINQKISDEIKGQQEFRKALLTLLEANEKNAEEASKSLISKVNRILEFEDHNMDFLLEIRDEVRKPVKKAGKKKKTEAAVETREDLEQL